jgi:hypothetical protein
LSQQLYAGQSQAPKMMNPVIKTIPIKLLKERFLMVSFERFNSKEVFQSKAAENNRCQSKTSTG